MLPALARKHRVYAPDLPGSDDSATPVSDHSSAFFEQFVAAFVDVLNIGRATFIGSSLGGLIALRLALSEPARVGTLVLVDSAGLGRAVNLAFTSVNVPCLVEAAMPLWRTWVGAYQRAWGRAMLLFAHHSSTPREWLAEQCRMAQSPGYLEAHLTALRTLVDPAGQREVLVDRLPLLEVPTLIVWGERDRAFPESQARSAAARLRKDSLAVIPDCGHLPHIECPDQFVATLERFLDGSTHHR